MLTGGAASAVAVWAEALDAAAGVRRGDDDADAWPTSAGDERVGRAVAPAMSAQLVPAASQRCHW